MKILNNSSNFETCPEYAGPAVCVDVTPLEKRDSIYGESEFFKIVFEISEKRSGGDPFCIWSRPFTPSLNPKSNLRKFLNDWFGHASSSLIDSEFETENLIGMKAYLIIMHVEKNDQIYSQIKAIRPLKADDGSIEPSGRFIRKIDRREDDAPAAAIKDPVADVMRDDDPVLHVGKFKGKRVSEIEEDAVIALWTKWRPTLKQATDQDSMLVAALTNRLEKMNYGEDKEEEQPF